MRYGGSDVGGSNSGLEKVEIRLRWDPSPLGEPPHHLDIIGAVYSADAPGAPPVFVVHTESRSPDGTITMGRHSETGQGFGFDEVMVLEFDRMASTYRRIVVGVAIHQDAGTRTFGAIANPGVVVVERYRELLADDFTQVTGATAATVAEFTRDGSGGWGLHEMIRGFDSDPVGFMAEMGGVSR
ncbi:MULTISPECIES: TerD family protein [unclassified Streptomyces]|uniref:TerD family protein n=1 Tax=unclassified Streptomyces TaxID=2593676 RepID=UPI002E0DD71B|nr:TerD family protein [Streptomyces sp. NBC_01197]WSS53300.1 TerD family protein [Streptomyces sp. NBC_01180]